MSGPHPDPLRLVLATGNLHKAQEIQGWLRGRGHAVDVLPASEFGGMQGCIESAEDFQGNALIKVDFLRGRVPKEYWVIADDSGLEVDALNGKPGVRSARFAGEDATDLENRELLLERMKKARSVRKRRARFVCVLALAKSGRRPLCVQGICEGSILKEAIGNGGFGYDPIFSPDGYEESFAQMTAAQKNRISHRSKALEELEKVLTA